MKYRISADKLGLTTYTNSLQKAFQIFDEYTKETNKAFNWEYMTISEMEKEEGRPITVKDLMGCDEIFFSIEED